MSGIFRHLLILFLGIGLLSLANASPDRKTLSKLPVPRQHEQPGTLDENPEIALTALPVGNAIHLHWLPDSANPYWAILRSEFQDMSLPETLAVTSDTFWIDDKLSAADLTFYQIHSYPLTPPPDSAAVIVDFESGPYTFTSIPGQDSDPNDWEVTSSDAYGGTANSLRLYGDTWKSMAIDPTPVAYNTVWEIAMKVTRRGEVQAIGIADSANWMRYPIWGSESWQADEWITVYLGWFEEDEWAAILLPIGEDWHGRFGYLPTITELHFINDNDNVNPEGVVFFDEIRDVTETLPYPPVVDFQWAFVGGAAPGSVRVQFYSLSYDPDSPQITYLWEFGDGLRSTLAHPNHDYPEHGRYTVTLTVEDQDDNVAWQSQPVEDPPVSMTREFRAAFAGDVILARGMENIIDDHGVEYIFDPTRHLLEPLDLTSVNQECPLTTASERHPTKGIVFKGRPEFVAVLEYAGVDFVTLANNHIIDYMEPGMLETQTVLDSVGIVHTGAGMNDLQARRAKFMSRNGLSVAMLGFCNRHGSYLNDQPFLDAGRSRPGHALWHNSAIEATIPDADSLADFVVINTHSGDEYVNEPGKSGEQGIGFDPEYEAFSEVADADEIAMRRYAIDLGADLVICHHPHVIQGFELHQGKLIAHSMGNYVFDLNYAECNPTIVLHANFTADNGIDEIIIHPVYVDHWIPQPATGYLGMAILDYETRLSRAMDTWLVRNPGEDTARIVFDTTAARTGIDWSDTLALQEIGPWWQSSAIEFPENGYPVSLDIVNFAGAEIRVGREKLWFGSMEDNGATPWNLNSGFEEYNEDQQHGGLRSIRHARDYDAGDNIVTPLHQRFYIDDQLEYSMLGWIMTENAGDAAIQARFWSQRNGGSLLSSVDVGGTISGDNPWTLREQDLLVPGGTNFFNVRLALDTPATGTGYAWYDDVMLIEWNPWQPAPADILFPNDVSFFQIRSASPETEAIVSYRTEWIP